MRTIASLYSCALLLGLGGCVGLDQYQADQGVKQDSAQPEAFGDLVLSRTSVNFGELDLGDAASESVILRNEGDLGIELLDVALLNGGDFQITTTLVGAIAPGAEQILDIEFSPSTSGDLSDVLVIETDALGAEYVEVALSGAGATEGGGDGGGDDDSGAPEPNASISATTFNFGTVDTGDVGTQPFTITNTGDADLTITNLVGSEGAFGWDRAFGLPYILRPGESKSGNLLFSPSAEQSYSGTVTLSTNDPDEPEIPLTVRGEGLQGCTICRPVVTILKNGAVINSLFFLTGSPGTASDSFTIQNEGDEELVVSSITLYNDLFVTAGTFSIAGYGSLPIRLTPFSSQNVTVNLSWSDNSGGYEVYTPPGLFDYQNAVVIGSNDPYTPEVIVELSALIADD